MSVVQSSTDLGLASLTSDFKPLTDEKDALGNTKASELVASDNQQDVSINTSASNQTKEAEQEPLTAQQLDKVAQQLQDFVGDMNRGLQFSVDKNSGRDVIKVVDKESGDLIKQYPSEEVLSLVAKLSEAAGALIDEKV
jgi:flagellar protein FlaG